LGRHGTRWFHTGGIFCALSESTPKIALEAIQAARSHGVIVSYDLNFRESLWRSYGGKEKAREVNRSLAPYIDVVFGNEEDFSAALGYAIPGMNERHTDFTSDGFKCMIQAVARDFPFRVVAATLRKAKTATVNDWGAICYTGGQFYQSMQRENLEIFDRVGGGDSFAAGLIYGLLERKNPQWAVECGAAHGALAMTTPGDTSMVDLKEVLRVMDGDGARITR
jgi:2-dehydro-3-deoxygluconokinase